MRTPSEIIKLAINKGYEASVENKIPDMIDVSLDEYTSLYRTLVHSIKDSEKWSKFPMINGIPLKVLND